MRNTALEFFAKGKLGIIELGAPPEPGQSQILLETKYTGLTNGTERHALLTEHGYGHGYPSRHGYQHVGEVIAIGENVSKFQKGDWAYYGGYVGHAGWNIIDENDLMIKLPESVERKYCALFGVAGVALRGIRRMGVSQADNVWVVGQGPIGHFVAQAARAAGAKVTVTDILEKRLVTAKKCGAHVVLNAAEKSTPQIIKEGGPYNYIYDCCSLESLPFDIFSNGLLAHSGTIGMMAVRTEVSYPWSLLHCTEAKIETSCHFSDDDLRVLLFLYEEGLLKIEPMVSHFVSIDEAPKIYDMLVNNANDLLGVIFDWTK